MRIISIKKLKDFWEAGYAGSEQPLKAWYQIFKHASFQNPEDIKGLFSSASFVANNRIVFNISGNKYKYRLIVFIRYDLQITYIRFIGTHAEYDKINVEEV